MRKNIVLNLVLLFSFFIGGTMNVFANTDNDAITVKKDIPKLTLNKTKIKFIDEELKNNSNLPDGPQGIIPDAKREYSHSYLLPEKISRYTLVTRSTNELKDNKVLTSVPRGGTNTIERGYEWTAAVEVKASYEAKSAGLLKAFVNTSLNMELTVSGEYKHTVKKGETRTGYIEGHTGDYNSVLYCGGINYSRYFVECTQIDVYKVYDYNPHSGSFVYSGTEEVSKTIEEAEVLVPFYHEYSLPVN